MKKAMEITTGKNGKKNQKPLDIVLQNRFCILQNESKEIVQLIEESKEKTDQSFHPLLPASHKDSTSTIMNTDKETLHLTVGVDLVQVRSTECKGC